MALARLTHRWLLPPHTRSQVAICFGFVTPLFICYVVEARHKLAFARRLGLLPPADGYHLINDSGTLLRHFDSHFTCLLLWLNFVLFSDILTVAAVEKLA